MCLFQEEEKEIVPREVMNLNDVCGVAALPYHLTAPPFPISTSNPGLTCVGRFYRVIKVGSGIWRCVYSEHAQRFPNGKFH